jgi:hypothetical protein
MKERCKRCFTTLRRREISMSDELNEPYAMCSDCLGRKEWSE